MWGDDYKWLAHLEVSLAYAPKEKWIGLRNAGSPNEREEAWRDRKGLEQMYQLNILPCIAICFKKTWWTSTKKEKKKK